MKHTYLLAIALSAFLLPSCEKKDAPPARETSKEEVKDALDTRDNELVKDVVEEIKEDAEAVEEAAEATVKDIKEVTGTAE